LVFWASFILRMSMSEWVDKFLSFMLQCAQHVHAATIWWFEGDLTSGYLVMLCIILIFGCWYSGIVQAWTSWAFPCADILICAVRVCSDSMTIWRGSDVPICRYNLEHFCCALMIFSKDPCRKELTDFICRCHDMCSMYVQW